MTSMRISIKSHSIVPKWKFHLLRKIKIRLRSKLRDKNVSTIYEKKKLEQTLE
jgi:hypothetical protein